MQRICFTIQCILITICCFSQAKPTYFMSDSSANKTKYIKANGIKKEDVYGYILSNDSMKRFKIKDSALTYTCTYDSFGNPLIRQHLFQRVSFTFKDSLVYDSYKRLIKIYMFTISKGVQKIMGMSEYTYDGAGERPSSFNRTDSETNQTYRSVGRYTYNEKDQLVQLHSTFQDTAYSVITYYYDKDGDIIRSDHSERNGQILFSLLREYNQQKNKVTHYSLHNNWKHKDYELHYDQEGRCILLIPAWGPTYIETFSYKPNGLFSEMKRIENGHVKQLNRHFYFTE